MNACPRCGRAWAPIQGDTTAVSECPTCRQGMQPLAVREEMPEQLVRVLRAGLTLLRRTNGAASIRLRLSRDRAGVERLTAESFDGLRIEQLAESLTDTID